MLMRILVTGAAGFIASKVSELLLAAGHQVVGVDNLNDAYDVRLKHWRLQQLLPVPGFSFHQLDICDLEALRPLFREPFDAVINLAARAGVRYSVENPWVYVETNVTGTLNLLELCRQHGIRKFVLASTSSLYGTNNPVPFSEDANTDGPLSPYAASKKAAEALCYTYHHLYGLDVSVLRYFTVYGPAGRPDMALFKFVDWLSRGEPIVIYGDGSQSRDFTYVDDIARGTVAALKPLGFEVINLGSDRPVVLLDAVRVIEELMGCRAQIRWEQAHAADMPATWADIGKARKLLDWAPRTTLNDGLVALVGWYGGAWSQTQEHLLKSAPKVSTPAASC